MAIIAFILVVIFTVINLRIYHKIFHVVYFNMGQALFREIFWSFFIAMFEAGVIITCIEPILNGVLKLLGILGKILLRNCREIIYFATVPYCTGCFYSNFCHLEDSVDDKRKDRYRCSE